MTGSAHALASMDIHACSIVDVSELRPSKATSVLDADPCITWQHKLATKLCGQHRMSCWLSLQYIVILET
jgi:hypothetical protein